MADAHAFALAAVLGAMLVERGVEVRMSRPREALAVAAGARAVRPDGFAGIVAVHALFFLGMAAEGALAPWARLGSWTAPALVVAAGAEALRWWSIHTLGPRWNVRVLVHPDTPLVADGPYRWTRHPNYVAVAVLLVAVPAAFGCWATAGAMLVLHPLALWRRVRIEDAALAGASAVPPAGPTFTSRG